MAIAQVAHGRQPRGVGGERVEVARVEGDADAPVAVAGQHFRHLLQGVVAEAVGNVAVV